ncbi:adhesion G protein-coupled receptor E2-like [Macrotis lagotis]|uniref:adhesion G protein-coupled receptor E2-like n=1 Tax=Macrotis lagotis TaxID=92651 RepID=UPI003D68A0AA
MQGRGIILLLGLAYLTSRTRTQMDNDLDKCRDSTVCPPYSICINIPGSYTCVCKKGFVMGPTMECQDVDECSQNPLICGPNTKCTNVFGKYKCSCMSGFSSPRGDSWIPRKTGSFQCTDINECLRDSVCPQNSTCQNTPGSYVCTCNIGFTFRNSQCEDVDECADSTVCPQDATCINTPGNYTCDCKNGFVMGPRMECQDVDECYQNPLVCGPNTKCTNVIGKYRCSCLTGFSSPMGNSWVPGKTGSFQCSDINECLSDSVCPQHSTCQNTPGSYGCTCNTGFIFKNSQCEDMDECAGSAVCSQDAICINTPGNYTCICKNGFVMGPKMECQDVDECADFTVCSQDAICINTPGNYTCDCKNGFVMGPKMECQDVDECADSTVCPPHATCINTPGNYTCDCKNGFVMGPRMECQDIDECSQNPLVCGPNAKCTNVIGKYRCICLSGFSSPMGNSWVPGKTGSFQCSDINECLRDSVCPQHSTCQNTPGSYGCTCNTGFTFKNSQCEDVDECADSTVCPPYATCINTPGNYTCDCKNGFVMGPRMECQDVNECSQNLLVCGPNTKCTNVIGTYRCSCLTGFSSPRGNSWVPGKTGSFQCTDINECLRDSVCPQHSTCQNTPGSYGCTCNTGFTFRNSQCEDVDECADSTVCPQDAICINTPGNYTCDCNNGFVMGPKMECQDVDECMDATACPTHATCTNTLGNYFCTCKNGYKSSTSEVNFQGQGTYCEDVDECADSTVCPPYAICINNPGNYTCVCKHGFVMGPGMKCQDVDECSQNPLVCGPNTKCTNVIGKYSCNCLPGFSSPRGNSWIPDRIRPFQCTDINECLNDTACPQYYTCWNTPGSYDCTCNAGFTFRNSQCEEIDECMDATACPTHATCTNTLGNYFCTCKNGYKSSTSEVSFRGQGILCKRILVRCKEDLVDQEKVKHCQSNSTHPVFPEYISYCKLVDSILEDICENVSLKKAAENFASVLEEISTWHILRKEEASTLATVFLDSVENVTLSAIVSLSGNTSQTVKNKYLEIESKVIQDHCLGEFLVLSAKGDSMKIDCRTINESVSMGTLSDITGIAFTSFVGMESILNEKFFYNSEANLIGSSQNLWMNSRVIGSIITGNKKENFSNPVIYTLENLQPKKKSDRSICISWDPEIKGGRWTSTGCVILSSNETQTTCSCNHLANMAVIMASREITMDFALFWISHVGMILSLLCLALAIITFLLLCRSIWNHIITIHLHLCICLFLAKLLFLIGVVRTENKIVCAVIAGLLHYLFLACFAWMLVEAMMLFLMVRNYFSSQNIKMLHLYTFGYGLPGLIVLVSAGIQWEGYGMNDRCWLNTENGFIWSFLGPVCTIIMINSVLLTGTLWILRKKLSNVNADIATLKDNRLLTFKAFAQLFILGCSWILEIFQIGPVASTVAYLFSIINSLQGTFIFIIHCILSHQVREEYKKCFTGRL